MKIKKILLEISDEAYKEWQDTAGVKMMIGNSHGISDAIVAKIISGLKKNDKKVYIAFKDEEE